MIIILNAPLSYDVFLNCRLGWFGSRCEYAFRIGKSDSIDDTVSRLLRKKLDSYSLHSMTKLTCYIHLECDRDGSSICLGWREICNGRIDCLNGGQDEASCFELEINECKENEYRCHNGLCISNYFVKGTTAECLDRSDVFDQFSSDSSSGVVFRLIWSENACRPDHGQFSCGDNQCIEDFDQCDNGRQHLIVESMVYRGNLPHECRLTMACLTKIIDRTSNISCEQSLATSTVHSHLASCGAFVQFPVGPVLFVQVSFVYRLPGNHYRTSSQTLVPDYVCYDVERCDFLQPTFRHGNLTCQNASQVGLDLPASDQSWKSMIDSVRHFFRACSVRKETAYDSSHKSLFCCRNSSKCISKHRIMDGMADCSLKDDEEEWMLSCSVNNGYRFQCPDEKKCYSPLVSQTICPRVILEHLNDISFLEICDRTLQTLPILIDGQNHTDETECDYWPCNNIFTQCDRFWSCPTGEDEDSCTQSVCPAGTLECLSSYNYTFICLPAVNLADGVIDCLGRADEQEFCRQNAIIPLFYHGFYCLNDTRCLGPTDICNNRPDCKYGDDEVFCGNRSNVCVEQENLSPTELEKILCRTTALSKNRLLLKNVPIYPRNQSNIMGPTSKLSIKQAQMVVLESKSVAFSEVWRFHYGLPVHVRMKNTNDTY